MSYFQNKQTTRHRAHVVPADACERGYGLQTIYYLDAVDYWEAKRTLDAVFDSSWKNLTEADRGHAGMLCRDTVSLTDCSARNLELLKI